MARYDFGGTLADFVVTSRRLGGLDVLGLSAATLTFWSAQSGGTRYTDLVLNGSAASSIVVGTDGQVPKFQGPDGVTEMWVDGGSPRIRLVTLQGAPGPAGPIGPGSTVPGPTGSTGPQGPQGIPGVNAVANDTATASQISTPGTATDTALKAGYAQLTSVATTATASATLAANRHTPVNATSAALTMTLPTAPAGVLLSVEKTDATTNAVNVTGTLRGVASQTIALTSQYDARTFLSEGSGSWRPVSDHRTASSLSATAAVQANAVVTAQVRGDARTYGVKPTLQLGPDPKVNTVDGTGAWFIAGTGTGGAGALTRDATGGHKGAPAALLTFTSDPTGGGAAIAYGHNSSTGTGRIPARAGQDHAAAIYGQGSVACTLSARLYWLDSSFNIISSVDGPSSAVDALEQRRLFVTGTAPANAAWITVQARISDATPFGVGDKFRASKPTIVTGINATTHVSGDEPGAVVTGVTGDSPIVGPPEVLRIAHWGDSIAFLGSPSDSVSNLAASEFDCAVFNGGVTGESSTQIMTRQTADTTTQDWVQIIGAGHNGASGAFTPAQIVADIQAMVDHLTGPRRFLIMELLPWASHTTTQRANYNAAIAATKAAFPKNFVEVATWLRSQAAATAMGITFTSTDLADIAAGNTPTVFRGTDDIHPNLIGRRAYSKRVQMELALRGWTAPATAAAVASSSSVTEVRVDAGDLLQIPGVGSPTVGSSGSMIPTWQLHNGVNEAVGAVVRIPPDWTTFSMTVQTENGAAGTGSYTLRPLTGAVTPGVATTPTTGSEVAVTAAGVDVVQETTLVASLARPASGALGFRVDRRGASATVPDTLANVIGLVGVVFRKLT